MATESTFVAARILGILFGGIGILGLIMASVGVYSAVGFAVSQQTREIGIRMALGAEARAIVRLMLARSLGPVWAGLAAGVLGGAAVARALSAVVAGLQLLDPVVVLLVCVALGAVTVAAAYLPARRAAAVDPATTLRLD